MHQNARTAIDGRQYVDDKTGVSLNSASPGTGDAALRRSAAAGDIPPPGARALHDRWVLL